MMLRWFYLSVLLPAGLIAQTFNTGTFFGTITDSSGAAVPGATIRITRVDPPLTREAITDAGGNFQVQQVPVGQYRFEFEKTGFQKVVRSGIDLSAGQSLRVDTTLNVGSVRRFVMVP